MNQTFKLSAKQMFQSLVAMTSTDRGHVHEFLVGPHVKVFPVSSLASWQVVQHLYPSMASFTALDCSVLTAMTQVEVCQMAGRSPEETHLCLHGTQTPEIRSRRSVSSDCQAVAHPDI
ncbi:hypothetical protein CBL_00953 [Carabus blaptoides fortunei]